MPWTGLAGDVLGATPSDVVTPLLNISSYGAASFSIHFSFLFFYFFVASKGSWLVGWLRLLLSFVIFWFNLLNWS